MIESSDNTISYVVAASDTFAFPYRYLDADFIECYLTDGETVRQLESGEFGVNAISGSVGANIVLAIDPLPAGQTLTIRRVVPLTQGLTLPNTGKLPTESLELQLDKIVMIAQQLGEMLGRCVKTAIGSGADPDALVASVMAAAASSAEAALSASASAGGASASAEEAAAAAAVAAAYGGPGFPNYTTAHGASWVANPDTGTGYKWTAPASGWIYLKMADGAIVNIGTVGAYNTILVANGVTTGLFPIQEGQSMTSLSMPLSAYYFTYE